MGKLHLDVSGSTKLRPEQIDVESYKARLVVKGFAQEYTNYEGIFVAVSRLTLLDH